MKGSVSRRLITIYSWSTRQGGGAASPSYARCGVPQPAPQPPHSPCPFTLPTAPSRARARRTGPCSAGNAWSWCWSATGASHGAASGRERAVFSYRRILAAARELPLPGRADRALQLTALAAPGEKEAREPANWAYGCAVTSICAKSFPPWSARPRVRPRRRTHGEAVSSPNSGICGCADIRADPVRTGRVAGPSSTVPGNVDSHLHHDLRLYCPAIADGGYRELHEGQEVRFGVTQGQKGAVGRERHAGLSDDTGLCPAAGSWSVRMSVYELFGEAHRSGAGRRSRASPRFWLPRLPGLRR